MWARTKRPISARRAAAAVALACALGTAGCGGGGEPSDAGSPTRAELPAARDPLGAKGRALVTQVGCLACHRIGGSGNAGPGRELTTGRTPAAIEQALADPKAPMPSYESLGRGDRRAIVAYLASLRAP